MTNLHQHLAELTTLLAKPDPKTATEKAQLAANLLPLVGLAHGAVEVPVEVFESLDNEGRKLALASLASVLIQTHDL